MRWWASNRCAVLVTLVTVVLGLATHVMAQEIVVVPALFAGLPVTVPLGYFGPLVIIVVVGHGLARAPLSLEWSARRPVRLADAGLCLGQLLVLALCVPGAHSPEVSLVLLRNSAVGVGLMLVAGRWLPRQLMSLPAVMWFIVGTLTGVMPGREAVWNWPLMSAGNPHGVVWAAVSVAAGVLAVVVRPSGSPHYPLLDD